MAQKVVTLFLSTRTKNTIEGLLKCKLSEAVARGKGMTLILETTVGMFNIQYPEQDAINNAVELVYELGKKGGRLIIFHGRIPERAYAEPVEVKESEHEFACTLEVPPGTLEWQRD